MSNPPITAGRPLGDVFISHHSSQYEAGKAVKDALAAVGIRGWLAPDDVDPGSAFDTQIVDQLKRSDAIVLLLSAEADRSRHVKRELMLADDGGIAVFPVRIERIQAEGLAYFLKDRQWIDWFGARGDGLERLVAAVKAHYSGAPSRPLPATPPARKPRWPWLAAGLAVLAAAGIAAWLLIPRLTEPAAVVRPGLWLNKREMVAVTFPKLAADAVQQIKESIENDPNPEECIGEDVARNPDVRLFDPGNKGHCTLSSFQIGNGRMTGYLVCPMPGMQNAVVQTVFRGDYTPTTITVDQDVTMVRPEGSLKVKVRDSSHWVAAECNTERH